MGKPAARLLDMTAHGGMITGPGATTVLIGKMPAARMTDMHTCPMCNGPVPHVGGLEVGPVPPTVFVSKMPAACAGDMFICTGPPSTALPPGCMTVLLGQAGAGAGGGGGGGGAGGGAGGAAAGGGPATVEGTESMPVEIQASLANAAKYMKPDQVKLMVEMVKEAYGEGGSGGEEEEETPLTVADFVEILKANEKQEGYEAARHFASYLDYGRLNEMTMAFTNGSDTDPDNDPNQMPTRFMILYGADDAKLQEIDDHPDRFEGEEHKMNVENLRKGLRLLGYEVAETGPYDDEVYRAHLQYMASVPPPSPAALDELEEDDAAASDPCEGTLKITLDIDPDDQEAQDDTFTLYSTDKRKSYSQTKTVKDDAEKGNRTLELEFSGLNESLSYTLEVDLGTSGQTECVFRNRSYGKWK